MKMKKNQDNIISLPKGFVVSSELDNKYEDQPLFKTKVEKTNHILKTVGIPPIQK